MGCKFSAPPETEYWHRDILSGNTCETEAYLIPNVGNWMKTEDVSSGPSCKHLLKQWKGKEHFLQVGWVTSTCADCTTRVSLHKSAKDTRKLVLKQGVTWHGRDTWTSSSSFVMWSGAGLELNIWMSCLSSGAFIYYSTEERRDWSILHPLLPPPHTHLPSALVIEWYKFRREDLSSFIQLPCQ